MKIALSINGKYVCAENGGDDAGIVHVNRTAIGPWETWTVEFDGDNVAFKSCNGRYLCAELGGGGEVCANRLARGPWELFRPQPAGHFRDGVSCSLAVSNGEQLRVGAGDELVATGSGRGDFTVTVVEADVADAAPDGGPLRRLVRVERSRHRFVDEGGVPHFLRMASMFLLYKRFLKGEDITPQLSHLQGLRCNAIRVMGMFESLGGFTPKEFGDAYYTRIPEFHALCATYGIYVLWTACAATGGMFPTADEVLAHIRRTVEQLLTTQNALFSPVNEQGQHNNSIDRVRVIREISMGWLLYDTGSFGMDLPCEPPFGTHVVLHVNRRYPNSVKDSCILDHPNYVGNGMEVLLDEPDRYGDDGNPNVQQASDAAGTAFTALGWCFHSMQGERGELLSGNTLDCARAAFGAMKGH